MGEVGCAGNHGGLHTTSPARPAGNRSARRTSTCPASPSRARLSAAQASARGSWSVAMTLATPRRASTAASTPEPVPMSNASSACGGNGAFATRPTYSPRTGENTP